MVLQGGSGGKWFQYVFSQISPDWGGQESEPLKYEALVFTHFPPTFLFLKKIPYFPL